MHAYTVYIRHAAWINVPLINNYFAIDFSSIYTPDQIKNTIFDFLHIVQEIWNVHRQLELRTVNSHARGTNSGYKFEHFYLFYLF